MGEVLLNGSWRGVWLMRRDHTYTHRLTNFTYTHRLTNFTHDILHHGLFSD